MKRRHAPKRVHHTKRRAQPKRPPVKRPPVREAENRGLDAYDRISFGYDLGVLPGLEDALDLYSPS